MADITLDNVTVSYQRNQAVRHISGSFADGTLTAIAGPNGAGKSTLLKAIAGILSPSEGKITMGGGGAIAYLPQASDMQRDFPLSLLDMVTTGFWQQSRHFGRITPAMKERAMAALAMVGLRGFEKRDLASLSAGQFQRALFARLLLQDSQVILLDEPFTSVDESTTAHLLDLVLRLHQESRTVICVLHNFEQIRQYFPQCLLLARECIAWGSTEKVLQPEHMLKSRFLYREEMNQYSDHPIFTQKNDYSTNILSSSGLTRGSILTCKARIKNLFRLRRGFEWIPGSSPRMTEKESVQHSSLKKRIL